MSNDQAKKQNDTPVVTELDAARTRIAIASPEHLARFLKESDREYLVLRATDLARALPWPDGVEYLQQIVQCYRDHRATIPTGLLEKTGAPIFKSEHLEPEEIDEAIQQLNRLRWKAIADREKAGVRKA